MRLKLSIVATCAVAMCASMFAVAQPASGEDAPFVDWASLSPGLAAGYVPTSANECVAGRERCVSAVVRELRWRFDPLAEACDHDAIFALSYLRTTEEYKRTADEPDFFADRPFVNHEDAVFAAYCFDAYDAWHRNQRGEVSEAWRIAFDAADRHGVSAAGNLELGINAHVQRDLPFVLEAIGLVRPDGGSRKPDHDRVNEFLNRVTDGLIAEVAARFDPTIDDSNLPGSLDETLLFQTIAAWREVAWRNAERLASAPTSWTRALVARQIEDAAAAQARLLAAGTHYGPLASSAARDAYCAANR